MASTSYPTQEDELRAKEADAEDYKRAEEAKFLDTFRSVPKNNGQRLSQLSQTLVDSFNRVMVESRFEPYEKQEDLMVGLKTLIKEEISVIDARRQYSAKINPSTAMQAQPAERELKSP